jgi:hypothetical protein
MLRHSAQRGGLAVTKVPPGELRHQPMQTTHIVYKSQQMHKKLIYYNYVIVNRVVADHAEPMDETDTNEVIVTATNHEHAFVTPAPRQRPARKRVVRAVRGRRRGNPGRARSGVIRG